MEAHRGYGYGRPVYLGGYINSGALALFVRKNARKSEKMLASLPKMRIQAQTPKTSPEKKINFPSIS